MEEFEKWLKEEQPNTWETYSWNGDADGRIALARRAWDASRKCERDLLMAAERYIDFLRTSDTGMGTEYSGVHPETQLKNAIASAKEKP